MRLEKETAFRASNMQNVQIAPNLNRSEKTANNCCFCVEHSPCFWKELNAKSAAKVLVNAPVGSYLIRPSTHPQYDYTLSMKVPVMGVTHIRVGKNNAGLYCFELDDTVAGLTISSFKCVMNMIDAWSRVYREVGVRSLQHPIPCESSTDTVSYINVENKSVCFHDDEEAKDSVCKLVKLFSARKAPKPKNC